VDGGDPATASAVLHSRSRALDDDLFPWSGYCMLDLLDYLSDRDIPRTEVEYPDLAATVDNVVAVFGPHHRHLRPQLDPAAFTPDELIESMSAFDFDVAEATMAATDGLTALRTGIDALGDGDLLVITVG
jgi:hypothetical protein